MQSHEKIGLRRAAAFLLAGALSAVATAPAAQAAEECRSLTLTGHPHYPPIMWAENGDIVGASPNIISLLAKRHGIHLVLPDFGSWTDAQRAVRDGHADGFVAIYHNAERAEWLDFLEPPFTSDPVAVYVRSDPGFRYAGAPSLEGRRGVSLAGESFGTELDAFITRNLNLFRVEHVKDAFAALVEKRADYIISGLHPAQSWLFDNDLDTVTLVDNGLTLQPVYIALSKESPCRDAVMRWSADLQGMLELNQTSMLIKKSELDWMRKNQIKK